jgi:hypothetical protein
VDDTLLRFQLISARTEILVLRSHVVALEQRNKELKARLRQYENPNTPISKEGDAGAPPDDNSLSSDKDYALQMSMTIQKIQNRQKMGSLAASESPLATSPF